MDYDSKITDYEPCCKWSSMVIIFMSFANYVFWQLFSWRNVIESFGSGVEWGGDIDTHIELIVVHESV